MRVRRILWYFSRLLFGLVILKSILLHFWSCLLFLNSWVVIKRSFRSSGFLRIDSFSLFTLKKFPNCDSRIKNKRKYKRKSICLRIHFCRTSQWAPTNFPKSKVKQSVNKTLNLWFFTSAHLCANWVFKAPQNLEFCLYFQYFLVQAFKE